MARDKVFISELRADTVIGIYDWEREIRQSVVIDVEMACDCARAAETESVADTLDYKAIGKRIIAFVEASEFFLVETLAHRLAEALVAEFGIGWLRLKVNKEGALRGARGVGVIVERGTRDGGAAGGAA